MGESVEKISVKVQEGSLKILPTSVKGDKIVIFAELEKGLQNGHRIGV